MRNIFINKEQYNFIKEAVENQLVLPSWISSAINNGKTPLSSNKPYINTAILRMIEKYYADAVKSFSDDITKVGIEKVEDKLNKLILICQKKEDKIKTELEKLCSDIALSLFELNGRELELECNLVPSIEQTKDFHIRPDTKRDVEFDSIDDINTEDQDEVRRRYTNAISMGAALELTDAMISKCVKDIFELDEELPYLYTKIIKINNYLLLVNNKEITDKDNFQDAYNKVTVYEDSNSVKILSEGIIFPFLLTETIRACIDVMTSVTLPEKRADYIMNMCDALEYEPMYMMLGRVLWSKVCGDDFDETNTEKLLQKILSLNTESFNALMDEIVVGTKLGKQGMQKILDKVKYESDYQSFEKDLAAKRKEKEIIVDGYFTQGELDENEIEEANYPESFNMEEFKQLKSFNARVQYCKARLKYLGKGSSRIVFQIDNGTVLKLAFNQKGVSQNEAEAAVKNDYVLSDYDFLPEVYDVDENYLWIEMQSARRARQSDFKRITGYNYRVFYYWILYCWNKSVAYRYQQWKLPEEYDRLFSYGSDFYTNFEYSLFQEIEDYIGNYGIQGYGDLQAVRNWGVVTNNDGTEKLVLIDNGLNNDTLEKYYMHESK